HPGVLSARSLGGGPEQSRPGHRAEQRQAPGAQDLAPRGPVADRRTTPQDPDHGALAPLPEMTPGSAIVEFGSNIVPGARARIQPATGALPRARSSREDPQDRSHSISGQ